MIKKRSLRIISSTKDLRTNTTVLYAQIDLEDYLNLVGENFDRFEIQRTRQKYKAYNRMQGDILKGALLPTITLAINPQVVNNYIKLWDSDNHDGLVRKLYDSKNIYILDGLQRTYIINDLIEAKERLKKGQKLLLEIWLEKEIKHLIYRLIVLNAGQKPMSMRHQVELLFMTMQGKLEEEIKDLELFKEKEETRRNKAKKLPFDRIVTAYYCFLTKSPEEKRENIVVKQMDEFEIFNSDEDLLSKIFFEFTKYLKEYVLLDEQVFRVYENSVEPEIKSPKNWLAEDNVINSFFSAVAQFKDDEIFVRRIDKAVKTLLTSLKKSKIGADPLALKTFSEIRKGINPKRVNVGFETRRILNSGWKEFFREEGAISFSDAWKRAAV
ncbi:MAG: hypothetical protein ACK5DD_08625 [Cyclobacteriaceae bacterium]|jgi:hypothetical protein